jgi:hypothetical protein
MGGELLDGIYNKRVLSAEHKWQNLQHSAMMVMSA